jgi:DNA-directed RNA polymerase specialized sigma24 family protein
VEASVEAKGRREQSVAQRAFSALWAVIVPYVANLARRKLYAAGGGGRSCRRLSTVDLDPRLYPGAPRSCDLILVEDTVQTVGKAMWETLGRDGEIGWSEDDLRRWVATVTARIAYRLLHGNGAPAEEGEELQSDQSARVGAMYPAQIGIVDVELLDSLPDDDRTIVSRAALGYSHAETASELGITEDASKQRLARAREKLREAVGGPSEILAA